MKTTLYRQWALLRGVPRYPAKITVRELHDKLIEGDESGRVSRRTIERDLQDLSRVFPLEQTDQHTKPTAWRWSKGARLFDVPGLDAQTALTFKLVATYLAPLLPVATLADLQPYVTAADGLLRGQGGRLGKWAAKVRVASRGQPLLAPRINPTVQSTVYEAVLRDRRLAIIYGMKGERQTREFGDVNPLGLVVKDKTIYLLVTLWDYQDVRQLALHRIKAAQLLPASAVPVQGFDIDRYIAGGAFGVTRGASLELVALFDKAAAAHLTETPLSRDQKFAPEDQTRVRVTATVADTEELRWWLLAFGPQVEVLKPRPLRTEMAANVRAMASRYGSR